MAKHTTSKSMADSLKEQVRGRIHKDFIDCAKRVNYKMYGEVKAMYKKLIRQFYDYETTSYIRHFEGKPGTRYGENLEYPISGIKMDNSHSPKLHVELDPGEISQSPPYEHHSPEQVLDYVTAGIRFVLPGTTQGMMTVDPTEMNYHGTYFSFKQGTINDAFQKFHDEWDNISREAFYSMWGNYVKKWKFSK